MNTKEDLERIKKHVHDLQCFITTPLIEWIHIIADKLDEYKKQIDEKQLVIDRLVKASEEK